MTKRIDDLIDGQRPMEPGPAVVPHGRAAKCAAKTRTGGTCGKPAGWGTDHNGVGRCKLHGGATPSGREASRRAVVLREAMSLAPDLERDEDPADVLISSLRRARALAAYWEDRITRGESPLHTVAVGGEHKPSVETLLWQQERDRAERLSSTCIKLGLDERRVRLAESVGDAVFLAIEAFAKAAGVSLDGEQGRAAFEAAAGQFERSVAAQRANEAPAVNGGLLTARANEAPAP